MDQLRILAQDLYALKDLTNLLAIDGPYFVGRKVRAFVSHAK